MKKVTALALVLTLAFSFPVPVNAAAASPPAPPSQELRSLTPADLPQELGDVLASFQGKRPETVVLIQDAHSVPDAQRQIASLIDFFQQKYGVFFVGVEGASEALDPQLFRSLPDAAWKTKFIETLMSLGEITGPSAAAILNPLEAHYQGLENWELYEQGIALFLEADRSTTRVKETISAYQTKLEADKRKTYSEKLLRAEKLWDDFTSGRSDLIQILEGLSKFKAPEPGSETHLLFKALREETSALHAVNEDLRRAAAQIKKSLRGMSSNAAVRNDERFLAEQFQSFQNSRISSPAFGNVLTRLAEKYGLKIHFSKPLLSAAKQHQKISALTGTSILSALEHYHEAVRTSLIRHPGEETLLRAGDDLGLVERLSELELSERDWQALKENESRLRAQYPGAMSQLSPHLAFYKIAVQRDAKFYQNLLYHMRKGGHQNALVAAGGFHSEGLIKQLEHDSISYYLIAPKIREIPDSSLYKNHMRGQVSWKNYFESKNGKIDLYGAFVRYAVDRYISDHASSAGAQIQSWRDQIIMDLSKSGQVSKAGSYTRFLDQNPSAVSDEDLRKAWFRNIDRFSDEITRLKLQNQLSPKRVARLIHTLQSSATAAEIYLANALAPNASTRLLPTEEPRVTGIARAELRSVSDSPESAPANKDDLSRYREKLQQLARIIFNPAYGQKKEMVERIYTETGVQVRGWQGVPVIYLHDILTVLTRTGKAEPARNFMNEIKLIPWYRSLHFLAFGIGGKAVAGGVVHVMAVPFIRKLFQHILAHEIGHQFFAFRPDLETELIKKNWTILELHSLSIGQYIRLSLPLGLAMGLAAYALFGLDSLEGLIPSLYSRAGIYGVLFAGGILFSKWSGGLMSRFIDLMHMRPIWVQDLSKPSGFVTFYASSAPKEDAAEFFAYYLTRPSSLKKEPRFHEKYALLQQQFFHGAEFDSLEEKSHLTALLPDIPSIRMRTAFFYSILTHLAAAIYLVPVAAVYLSRFVWALVWYIAAWLIYSHPVLDWPKRVFRIPDALREKVRPVTLLISDTIHESFKIMALVFAIFQILSIFAKPVPPAPAAETPFVILPPQVEEQAELIVQLIQEDPAPQDNASLTLESVPPSPEANSTKTIQGNPESPFPEKISSPAQIPAATEPGAGSKGNGNSPTPTGSEGNGNKSVQENPESPVSENLSGTAQNPAGAEQKTSLNGKGTDVAAAAPERNDTLPAVPSPNLTQPSGEGTPHPSAENDTKKSGSASGADSENTPQGRATGEVLPKHGTIYDKAVHYIKAPVEPPSAISPNATESDITLTSKEGVGITDAEKPDETYDWFPISYTINYRYYPDKTQTNVFIPVEDPFKLTPEQMSNRVGALEARIVLDRATVPSDALLKPHEFNSVLKIHAGSESHFQNSAGQSYLLESNVVSSFTEPFMTFTKTKSGETRTNVSAAFISSFEDPATQILMPFSIESIRLIRPKPANTSESISTNTPARPELRKAAANLIPRSLRSRLRHFSVMPDAEAAGVLFDSAKQTGSKEIRNSLKQAAMAMLISNFSVKTVHSDSNLAHVYRPDRVLEHNRRRSELRTNRMDSETLLKSKQEQLQELKRHVEERKKEIEIIRRKALSDFDGSIIGHAIAELFEDAVRKLMTIYNLPDEEIAVLSFGSVARRQMLTHSDGDLIVLCENPELAKYAKDILAAALPEIGLERHKVAMHYWSRAEDLIQKGHLEINDIDKIEGARLIWGNVQLFHTVQEQVQVVASGSADILLQRFLFSEFTFEKISSAYSIDEPNLKFSDGYLRDLLDNIYRWPLYIGQRRQYADTFGELLESLEKSHAISSEEHRKLEAAEHFILFVRDQLHLLKGGEIDVLSRGDEKILAERFGIKENELLSMLQEHSKYVTSVSFRLWNELLNHYAQILQKPPAWAATIQSIRTEMAALAPSKQAALTVHPDPAIRLAAIWHSQDVSAIESAWQIISKKPFSEFNVIDWTLVAAMAKNQHTPTAVLKGIWDRIPKENHEWRHMIRHINNHPKRKRIEPRAELRKNLSPSPKSINHTRNGKSSRELVIIDNNFRYIQSRLHKIIQSHVSASIAVAVDFTTADHPDNLKRLLSGSLPHNGPLQTIYYIGSMDSSIQPSILDKARLVFESLGRSAQISKKFDGAALRDSLTSNPARRMGLISISRVSAPPSLPGNMMWISHQEEDGVRLEDLEPMERAALILQKEFAAWAWGLGTTPAELLKNDPEMLSFFQYEMKEGQAMVFSLKRFRDEMRAEHSVRTSA